MNVNSTDVDKIEIYETNNFDSRDLELLYVYENEEDINKIVDALNNTASEDGIVDMVEPEYELVLINDEQVQDKYFIWSTDNSSSIMDTEDTHTLFSFNEQGHIEFREFLTVEE